MPSDEYLDALYEVYYDSDRRSSVVDAAVLRKLARRILKEIRFDNTRQDTFRILDFGGGRGGASLNIAKQLARNRSITVTVVDRSFRQSHESVTEQGIDVELVRSLGQTEGEFDLVIASAVLEHIPRLAPVLRELLERTRDSGGVFYARSPYSLPLRQLYSKYDLAFPHHVHDLGPSFWNRMLDRHGIRVRTLVSRPSFVESVIWNDPVSVIAATVLKFPGRVEHWIRRSPTDYLWNWVGGWELLLTKA